MNYFESMDNLNRLRQVLDEWIGTPFRHACGVKGRGTDCIHFVLRIMEETGAVPPGAIKVKPYAKDWHLHNSQELLVEGIRTSRRCTELPCNQSLYRDGDIILFRFGRVSSHAAIYCNGSVYNSINGIGVVRLHFKDSSILEIPTHLFRVN